MQSSQHIVELPRNSKQTVPPRTIQRNTEPQAVKQGCYPHWFLPLLARGYSTWSKGGTAAAKPCSPLTALLAGLQTTGAADSYLPAQFPHQLAGEQGFACTKLWHSKLLKPSSQGGTRISWAHGTDLSQAHGVLRLSKVGLRLFLQGSS